MKKYVLIPLKVLLAVTLIISVARLASLGAGLVRDSRRFSKLKEEMVQASEAAEAAEEACGAEAADPKATDAAPDTGAETAKTGAGTDPVSPEEPFYENTVEVIAPQNTERFAAFTDRNPDFAGWITIEGTQIDYPVMYSPKDPDFYLHHDFDRNESDSGVPYIGKNCSLSCDNIILYAHNMKNGTMFAGLLKYADETYYREHPVIRFDTLEEDGTYDIIAVFRERVHYRDETDVFRYYNYCGELSEEQFAGYLSQIRAISLYDTGKTAAYGQQLLTLSTCSYHTENGRFVVVAVKR